MKVAKKPLLQQGRSQRSTERTHPFLFAFPLQLISSLNIAAGASPTFHIQLTNNRMYWEDQQHQYHAMIYKIKCWHLKSGLLCESQKLWGFFPLDLTCQGKSDVSYPWKKIKRMEWFSSRFFKMLPLRESLGRYLVFSGVTAQILSSTKKIRSASYSLVSQMTAVALTQIWGCYIFLIGFFPNTEFLLIWIAWHIQKIL